jgi:hypothetical protein
MRSKISAGYATNLLMLAYLTIGMVVVTGHSILLGIAYIVLILLSFLCVAYSWCAKCPCRTHACTHIWLGKLATLLPFREPGRWTRWEYAGTLFYLLGLHALPQYWLWQNKVLFALFWILALATFLIGPLHACKICANEYCPFNPRSEVADATTDRLRSQGGHQPR